MEFKRMKIILYSLLLAIPILTAITLILFVHLTHLSVHLPQSHLSDVGSLNQMINYSVK